MQTLHQQTKTHYQVLGSGVSRTKIPTSVHREVTREHAELQRANSTPHVDSATSSAKFNVFVGLEGVCGSVEDISDVETDKRSLIFIVNCHFQVNQVKNNRCGRLTALVLDQFNATKRLKKAKGLIHDLSLGAVNRSVRLRDCCIHQRD